MMIDDIQIEVHRKKIKNMHLYVKPGGRVTISVPISMDDEKIERFVSSKAEWIRKHVSRLRERCEENGIHAHGETLCVLGKDHRIRMVRGKKNSIVLCGEEAIFTVCNDNTEQRERFVREWYRNILKEHVSYLLPKWESATGLKASGWQTKYMRTRWGSCNMRTKKIWLNVQLAKKPLHCLECVILHELVHLTEPTHNERFKSLMDGYMPEWRDIRRSMNRS